MYTYAPATPIDFMRNLMKKCMIRTIFVRNSKISWFYFRGNDYMKIRFQIPQKIEQLTPILG